LKLLQQVAASIMDAVFVLERHLCEQCGTVLLLYAFFTFF